MQFLDRDDAKLQEEKLRRQIADRPRPKLVLYYKSGHRDYADAANAIAAAAGAFTEATLHFQFCVSGDGWMPTWQTTNNGPSTGGGGVPTAGTVDSMTLLDIDSKPAKQRNWSA